MVRAGAGDAASHFALHPVTLRALEYVVGVAIKDDFGFILAVYDDSGTSHSVSIGRGIPIRIMLDGPREPVEEARFKQMLEHARGGRLELEVPSAGVGDIPVL